MLRPRRVSRRWLPCSAGEEVCKGLAFTRHGAIAGCRKAPGLGAEAAPVNICLCNQALGLFICCKQPRTVQKTLVSQLPFVLIASYFHTSALLAAGAFPPELSCLSRSFEGSFCLFSCTVPAASVQAFMGVVSSL